MPSDDEINDYIDFIPGPESALSVIAVALTGIRRDLTAIRELLAGDR